MAKWHEYLAEEQPRQEKIKNRKLPREALPEDNRVKTKRFTRHRQTWSIREAADED